MPKSHPSQASRPLSLELPSDAANLTSFDAMLRLQREAESRAYSEDVSERRRRVVIDSSRIFRRTREIEAELAPAMLSAEQLEEWKDFRRRVLVPGPETQKGIDAERRLAPEAATFDERMHAILLKHANVPYGQAGDMVMSEYWHVVELAANSVEQAAYPGSAEARKRYAISLRGCARDLQGGDDSSQHAMERAIGALQLSLNDGTLGLWGSCQELVDFVGTQIDGKVQAASQVSSAAWHFIWDFAVVSRLRQVLPQRFATVPDDRTYRADKEGRILDDAGEPLSWIWDGEGSGTLTGEASVNPMAESALKELLAETGMERVWKQNNWTDTYRNTPEYRKYSVRRAFLERGTRAVACEALAEVLDGNFRFRHPKHIAPINWSAMDDEEFERFIFNLVSNAPGYSNVRWLTQTHAPDRGRDISANRTSCDVLTGTRELRIIFQCKHWRSRSIGIGDVALLLSQMELWTPPPLDELVIVTSGRFSSDAVQFIEKHNFAHRNPWIVMCPNSHLELLASS